MFRCRMSATSSGVVLSAVRLTIPLTAGDTTPEDTAHRWQRNIEQLQLKPSTKVIKPEMINFIHEDGILLDSFRDS